MTLIRGYRRVQGIVFRPGAQGSGTRILIDRLLTGGRPVGYRTQPDSRHGVAAAVSQGRADWGLAIKIVAREYKLA
jgi:putative molybdopterin biosynthesis protein